MLTKANETKQVFYYICCNSPKRETSLRGPFQSRCAGQHNFFRRNAAAVANRWQQCVQFDRPEIWTSELPLQRQTCFRLTNWPVVDESYSNNLNKLSLKAQKNFFCLWIFEKLKDGTIIFTKSCSLDHSCRLGRDFRARFGFEIAKISVLIRVWYVRCVLGAIKTKSK